MSFFRISLTVIMTLIVANTTFAAKPGMTAQSAGTPESKRLTELASQCAEDFDDLAGDIGLRLYKFRNAGGILSDNGRTMIAAMTKKKNLTKYECTDISAMLNNR